jgi:hypothetical protein
MKKRMFFLSMSLLLLCGNMYAQKTAIINADTNIAVNRQAGLLTMPCVPNSPAWYEGGNSNPLNSAIGTCTNQDFILKANNNQALWVKPNGYIGIGTATPSVKLDVKGSLKIEELTNSNTALPVEIIQGTAQWEGIRFTSQSLGKTAFEVRLTGGTSTNSRFLTFGSGKTYIGNFSNLMNNAAANDPYLTIGQPTKADKALNIVDNTNLASPADYFTVYGDGRTLIKSTNAIPFSLSNGSTGAFYTYEFAQSSGNVDMWTLNNLFSYGFGVDNAAVGHIWADVNQKHKVINFKHSSGFSQTWIGDQQPIGTHADFRLAVDGKLVAKSCYITAPVNWADYVFAPDYQVPNLYDIESYYKKNNHLPEMPTDKEVKENGINVGEMNVLLLKKIEELTILMVKQQREIDELKNQTNKF